MRVLIYHPVRLPPKDYGGVERVVLWLAKGLSELGVQVTVAAKGGSLLPEGVKLFSLPEVSQDPCSHPDRYLADHFPQDIDLVHFMAPPQAFLWEQLQDKSLLTVHGNAKRGEVFPLNTVFLSRDHARRHSSDVFVYNGIDPAEYRFEKNHRGMPWLFLSKTSWKVKNLSFAYQVCKKAHAELRIAGGNRPLGLHLRALFNSRVEWVGPVSGMRKAEILSEARGLLFPVLWDEPFGLVVVEALISGTPVIASRRGSLPELVPSDCGELLRADDEEGWVRRCRMVDLPWSAERCREWAMEKFHYHQMARSYIQMYERVLNRVQLNASPPQRTSESDREFSTQ